MFPRPQFATLSARLHQPRRKPQTAGAQLPQSFAMARQDGKLWGRLIESAVGAHLINTAPAGMEVTYWRERNQEVDFVLRQGDKLLPIEVKSGRNKGAFSGLRSFTESPKTGGSLLVGTGGVALEKFLIVGAEGWVG